MGQKRRAKAPPSPEDILCGKLRCSPRDLVALVHDVNPTGCGLSERETRTRYALKNRLQSHLIRNHADELRVVVSDDDHEVVLIEHVPSGCDACHAIVAELDQDARSWVWRMIDQLGDAEEPEDAVAPPRAATPEQLGIDRHTAILMLAECCEQHAEKHLWLRREYLLGVDSWSVERLDELVARARQRIEELISPEEGRVSDAISSST